MNKALIIIKSPGIGDLQILLTNIHHISKEIGKPLTVLAQKNTRAKDIFKYDEMINIPFYKKQKLFDIYVDDYIDCSNNETFMNYFLANTKIVTLKKLIKIDYKVLCTKNNQYTHFIHLTT